MSKRRLQRVLNFISGRSELFTIEHRFLNATLFITILIGMFVALDNLILFQNYQLFIISTIFLSGIGFWHFLSRKKRLFILPAFGLYFSVSVVLTYSWIVFSGINGPTFVFFSIFTAFFVYIFDGFQRLFVMVFTSVQIAILILIGVISPEIIKNLQESGNHLIDLNIGAVVFVFLLLFVILNFKKVHAKQQDLLLKTAEALRKELNVRKNAEIELAKFNENLENLLNIRTKKLLTELSVRKKAEQEVIREHNILRTIMEATPEAIALLDENGILIDCNLKTLELINQTSRENLYQKSFFEYLNFNNHSDIANQMLSAFKEKNQKQIEYSYTNWNGEFVALILLMETVAVVEEDKIYTILVAKDITHWKLAEEELLTQSNQLKELNATKDKFLSIIAHDLRNPLGAVIGFSDILTNNYDSISENEKMNYLNNIRLSAEAMLRLLLDLLDWSKSKSGTMVFKPEEINLFNLVNEVKEPLYYQALNKKIELAVEIKNRVYAFADTEMVKTILRNLVSNAIKFTPQNGNITIASNDIIDQNSNEFVEISVIDNGVGIKKENLDKISRIDQSMRTKGTNDETGTGLGLILCKELIEKNNGYFYIKSIENSGSTFTFALPKKK
ncbi:MAG: PAS domain-containing sensor histidine kinase [Bacteroidota bacterium]